MSKKYIAAILGLVASGLFVFAPLTSALAPVDHISVSPQSDTLVAGTSISWEVTAHRTDGTESDVTSFASFAVPAEAKGTLTGATYTSEVVGVWQIPVAVGSFSTTAYLTVVHDSPTTLVVTPDNATITADDALDFKVTLQDAHGNSWDASGQAAFGVEGENGVFTNNHFEPNKGGTVVVTASAAGLHSSVPVIVVPGNLASIVLNPSGRLTLEVDSTHAIEATLFDAHGNQITSSKAGFTVSGEAAQLTPQGAIKGVKPGTATLTASFGSVKADTMIDVIPKKPVAPTNDGQVLGETTNGNTNTNTNEGVETPAPVSNTNQQPAQTSDQTCTNIQLWVACAILAAYALVLLGYYALIKRDKDKSWWIFPILVTAIAIIVWTKYFCDGTYSWWPWILVLLGIFVTWYGRDRMGGDHGHFLQGPRTPGDDSQKPLF